MFGRRHLEHVPALSLVVVTAAACGGQPALGTAAPVAVETETPSDRPEAQTARDLPEVGERPPERSLLADLDEGDTLTYRVRLANGRELEVQMRISRVEQRGGSVAAQLSPLGTPLSETDPVYPRWVVGTDDGLFGLEEHVTLTEPGFVPIGDDGALVTEARTNVAWRVPSRWFRPSAGAFDTDPEAGWVLAGHQERVEGLVRGERCVRLERSDGDLRTEMLVCSNVGMMESTARGATADAPQSWRLVDLGGPTSPELGERP